MFFRIYTQMSGLTDSTGALVPLQGAAQLDMNVSCLFMHEVKIFFLLFNYLKIFICSSYDININVENMKNWNISAKIKMMIQNVNQ